MKFLISDYDGTLKPFDKDPSFLEKHTFNKNIIAVNNFIKDNNKFMISTGRNTNSIKKEIEKYKIDYNYLSSYNGRVIFDQNNKLINAEYIDNVFLEEILNIEEYIKNITLYDEYGLTDNKENLIYIYLTLDKLKNIKELVYNWKSKYPELRITIDNIFHRINIRKEYNKMLGIKKLLEKEDINIPKKDIITIGDEYNDLEMINEYDGYHMLVSNPILYFNSNNVATSVNKLIKKIK
ncbi:MAG: HAD-IIB family hydrolase [Bacilli bacterium]|nr:HAD-IIB family hydrolase [Bacilli bacterium]